MNLLTIYVYVYVFMCIYTLPKIISTPTYMIYTYIYDY